MRALSRIVLAGQLTAAFAGCCSTTEPPAPCVPEVIEAPPAEIIVMTPEARIPDEPIIDFTAWTDEQIREDQGAYVEAIVNDLLEVLRLYYEARGELIHLNQARDAAIAGTEHHDG